MTPEQKKTLAEVGQKLQKAFPDFHGSVRFNMNPGRDYANANIEQAVCLEYDGRTIMDLNRRSMKPNR